MLTVLKPLMKQAAEYIPFIKRVYYYIQKHKTHLLKSPEELDAHINDFYLKYQKDDVNGLKGIDNYCYVLSKKDYPESDPFSREYVDAQMNIYKMLTKKDIYSIENELTLFDFEKDKNNFFPYNTRLAPLIGHNLMTHGFAVKTMNLKPGAKIVEFGSGWGNLTMQLCLSGYQVTAVEVTKSLTDLLTFRAGLYSRDICVSNLDMIQFTQETNEKYDAALFLQSFHHCHDPVTLVQNVCKIMNPDGIICLVDEPILRPPSIFLPYPWGVRLDLNAIFYARKFGWLELGFQTSFLKKLFNQNGWNIAYFNSFCEDVGDIYIARRR